MLSKRYCQYDYVATIYSQLLALLYHYSPTPVPTFFLGPSCKLQPADLSLCSERQGEEL